MNKLAIAAVAAGLAVSTAAAAQERPTVYARWDFLPYAPVLDPSPDFEQTLEVRTMNPLDLQFRRECLGNRGVRCP